MSIVGAQDFWIAGAKIYFYPDPVDGVDQDVFDMGVLDSVNPNFEIEELKLEDPSSGVKKVVDTTLTKIDETYEVTVRNFAPRNLSLLFLGKGAVDFTQTADDKAVSHTVQIAGNLVQIRNDDAASTEVFSLDAVAGVVSDPADLSTVSVTTIVASTKVFTTGSDISADLSPGEKIVLRTVGLANRANAGTYTVVTAVGTAVTVEESPVADETAITGSLRYKAAADTGTIYVPTTDYTVYSLDEGILKTVAGGAITDGLSFYIDYGLTALSGKRQVNPQSGKGAIEGSIQIVWARDNNAEKTRRFARVSLIPSGSSITVDDYSSFTMTATIISDISETQPAGTLILHKGTPPTDS